MTSHLRFTDPAATATALSGGKGANLARLTQHGFAVPRGFIITAEAYRDFIGDARAVAGSVRAFSFGDAERLRQESAALRVRLAERALPASVEAGLRCLLASFPDGQAFAVRSSSTMEDLANAAFAGQHDTFLNVTGETALRERIKDCFLSLWQDRAIAYRQQSGFDHAEAAMAVVVQEMIRCEVAGVGFSLNPVTGDLGELVIDANFGLGESVVSGQGEVDHYEIGKADRIVRRACIARKTTHVACTATGTEERDTDEAKAATPCLTEAQRKELEDLLVRVERHYRFPQDIEWGFADGQLHLLQARPVTTLPARWTRDESAERFPAAITPLTWDFVEDGFHRSLAYSFRLMGFPACHGKWFGLHGHYVYGNQTVVDLYLKRAPFEVNSLEDLKAVLPRLRDDYRWVQELPVAWARELDAYLLKVGEFMAERLEEKTLREVWQFVLTVNERGAEYFQPNIAISITHGTLHHLLLRLLKLTLGTGADRLFQDLLGHCETKTATINAELFEIAELMRAKPACAALMRATTSREIVGRRALAAFPDVAERLEKFLRDHGHREVEFDMYHPTWREAPWVVLDNLRLMIESPAALSLAERGREGRLRQQQAEQELYNRLPAEVHFFFAEVLRLARMYTALDDVEHYHTTRLALPMRKGLRELGERLVRRGVLAEPMDVFFAHWAQLEAAVNADTPEGWTALAAAIRTQKAAYAQDRARTPEWVLGGRSAEAAEQADRGGDEGALHGLPGSAGVVEGPVFVVKSAEDFAAFPKGAVLVAPTTNPAWTPLFYGAVAVVTESGGPLSHGAVTARELGIPAVMAVRGCLTQWKNGERVRVDGAVGKVVRVGEGEKGRGEGGRRGDGEEEKGGTLICADLFS
jgi:phosphohistidine swiveling domain-containing protein